MYEPNYTREEMAEFLGRPVASFPSSVETKIKLAILLLKLATCRRTFPDDPFYQDVIKAAVFFMALDMSIKEKYEKHTASPFQSETIGSYSYSKMYNTVQNKDSTGILWFDTAVDALSLCGLENTSGETSFSGGIHIFEYDYPAVGIGTSEAMVLSPSEIEFSTK